MVATIVCKCHGYCGRTPRSQWKAVEDHDQRDAHLLAVGTMIARIAAPGLRIGLRLALEIRACHVVEQHFVLDCEQLAAALRQMRFERPCAQAGHRGRDTADSSSAS
jgi:hypothetical protein